MLPVPWCFLSSAIAPMPPPLPSTEAPPRSFRSCFLFAKAAAIAAIPSAGGPSVAMSSSWLLQPSSFSTPPFTGSSAFSAPRMPPWLRCLWKEKQRSPLIPPRH